MRPGADGVLKYFPAEASSPPILKALKTVLPSGVPVIVTGGITPDKLALWRASGASGFGLGGALYRPGIALGEPETACDGVFVSWRAR